jgi:hypothetical protein
MMRWIGVDLTAGTRESRFDAGPAPFVSVELDGPVDNLALASVQFHDTLTAFVDALVDAPPTGLAIDGPCGACGIALDAERRDFVFDAPATRPAERALARERIGLFWTTRATVENFDGAARWIARSFVLFEELFARGFDPVETHPHGVFTMRHRLDTATTSAGTSRLAKKTTPDGRRQRLDLLARRLPRSSFSDLDAALSNDDLLDAAAAALLAALRDAGRARALGEADQGGQIWLPIGPPLGI